MTIQHIEYKMGSNTLNNEVNSEISLVDGNKRSVILKVIDVINDLIPECEEQFDDEINLPIISELYNKLSEGLINVISEREDDEETRELYAQYTDDAVVNVCEANMSLLTMFGEEAVEAFSNMEPGLDMLMEHGSTTDIRAAIRIYADFIKKSSICESSLDEAYTYHYKQKILSVIIKFLNEDRIEIIVAACKLVITVCKHAREAYERELSILLSPLLKHLHRYNRYSQLNDDHYKISKANPTTVERFKEVKSLVVAVASALKIIFRLYRTNINSPVATEYIFTQMSLCEAGTNGNDFYNSHLAFFEMTERGKSRIMIIWAVVFTYLRKRLEQKTFSIDVLSMYSNILKKAAVMLFSWSNDISKSDEETAIIEAYKLTGYIIVNYEQCQKKEKINTEMFMLYEYVIQHLYNVHTIICDSRRAILACYYVEKMLLHLCHFMMDASDKCHQMKFVLALYVDVIKHGCSSDFRTINELKKIYIPVVLHMLAEMKYKQTLIAIWFIGEIARYGDAHFVKECKKAAILILKVLNEKNVCRFKEKSELNIILVREAAASTIAIILDMKSFKAGRRKNEIISEWLNCFPVSSNCNNTLIANDYLMNLTNERNKTVLGKNYENVAAIVEAFCQVISRFEPHHRRKHSKFMKKVEVSLVKLIDLCDKTQLKIFISQQSPEDKIILQKYVTNKKVQKILKKNSIPNA